MDVLFHCFPVVHICEIQRIAYRNMEIPIIFCGMDLCAKMKYLPDGFQTIWLIFEFSVVVRKSQCGKKFMCGIKIMASVVKNRQVFQMKLPKRRCFRIPACFG